jgi:hypothetical protein
VLGVRAAHALTDAFEGVDCDQDALLGQVGSDQIAHDQIAADIAARVSWANATAAAFASQPGGDIA